MHCSDQVANWKLTAQVKFRINEAVAMTNIPNLASVITEATKVLSTTDGGLTSRARTELATACARLMAVVESPVEAIFRMMMAVSLFLGLSTKFRG